MCENVIIEPTHSIASNGSTVMDILARRLTLISALMVVFAVSLAAAVSADTERRRHHGYTTTLADCTAHTAQFCQAKL
jgi:hypothetical protein